MGCGGSTMVNEATSIQSVSTTQVSQRSSYVQPPGYQAVAQGFQQTPGYPAQPHQGYQKRTQQDYQTHLYPDFHAINGSHNFTTQQPAQLSTVIVNHGGDNSTGGEEMLLGMAVGVTLANTEHKHHHYENKEYNNDYHDSRHNEETEVHKNIQVESTKKHSSAEENNSENNINVPNLETEGDNEGNILDGFIPNEDNHEPELPREKHDENNSYNEHDISETELQQQGFENIPTVENFDETAHKHLQDHKTTREEAVSSPEEYDEYGRDGGFFDHSIVSDNIFNKDDGIFEDDQREFDDDKCNLFSDFSSYTRGT